MSAHSGVGIPVRLRACLATLVFALASAGAARAASAEASAKTAQVAIQGFAFAPRTITVPAGTRVVWTNKDEEPHTVTSAGGGFASSAALDTGDAHAVTFARPGTYAYYCSIHPMMVGTIVVK